LLVAALSVERLPSPSSVDRAELAGYRSAAWSFGLDTRMTRRDPPTHRSARWPVCL